MPNIWSDKLPHFTRDTKIDLPKTFNAIADRFNVLFNITFDDGFNVEKNAFGWNVSLANHQNHNRIVRTLEEIPALADGVAGKGQATLLKLLEDGTLEDLEVPVAVYNLSTDGPVSTEKVCLAHRSENGRLIIGWEDAVCG